MLKLTELTVHVGDVYRDRFMELKRDQTINYIHILSAEGHMMNTGIKRKTVDVDVKYKYFFKMEH